MTSHFTDVETEPQSGTGAMAGGGPSLPVPGRKDDSEALVHSFGNFRKLVFLGEKKGQGAWCGEAL